MIKDKKRILTALTLIVISVVALTCAALTFSDINLISSESVGNIVDGDININQLGYEVNYPTVGDYGQLKSGTQYIFTDRSKVDSFRAGTITDDLGDLTKIEVDSSQPHGSQKNPYVIATVDDWTVFTQKIAVDSTHGSGKYYVLTNDLDFAGKTFYPATYFKGTFYGAGRALKNITCDNWLYWNGSQYVNIGNTTNAGFGVFCKAEDATITDLIVSNINNLNVPNLAAPDVAQHGPMPSGLIGMGYGTVNVLNTHVEGQISSNITYSNHTRGAGILAMQRGNAFIYRCSAEMTMSYSSAMSILFGGIIGQINASTSNKGYVLDCAANIVASGSGSYNHTAIAIATASSSPLAIENMIGSAYVTTTSLNANGGGLGASRNDFSVKNMYVDSMIGSDQSNLQSLTAIGGAGTYQSGVSTLSNIHQVKSTAQYATMLSGAKDIIALVPSERVEHPSLESLNAAAKAEVGNHFSDKIWDADKIGGSYDPDNTPVRNYLITKVSFKNLLSGDNEEGIGLSAADYRKGDTLPTPEASHIKTNHVFKGWTDDKSGESKPYTTLPGHLYGNETLYAVWGLPESYIQANITSSLSSDKNLIEYDSVDKITLTGNATHTAPSSGGMTNPSIRYKFIHDGKDKSSNNFGQLILYNVKDSGEYTCEFRIKDSNEPLWYEDVMCGDSVDVVIEKGKLEHMTLSDFKISEDTPPYYGKTLQDVDFSVKLINKAGIEVKQSAADWTSQIGTVKKGDNSRDIIIRPLDTDNYEASYQMKVEFQSVSLMIVFDLIQISQQIKVEVEYGRTYYAGEIINLFQIAYLEALSTWDPDIYQDVAKKAPYLKVKGSDKDPAPITPDGNGLPLFDGEFYKISEQGTIEVTFEDAPYNVAFDADNGGATQVPQQTLSYGDFVKKPDDPTYGTLLFLGWYFDAPIVDEDGNAATEWRAWRFTSEGSEPADRVTGNITLKAEWLEANALESISVKVNPTKILKPNTKLTDGDLIVKATYSGTKDGTTVKREVTLKWSDYSSNITYATNDKLLHVVDGGYKIVVGYAFNGGETKTAEVNLNVKPIVVDTGKLVFKDKVIICTDEEKVEKIDPVQGVMPEGIKGVSRYVYYKNGQEIDESEVKGINDFVVHAIFEMKSDDYYAEPLEATLSIRRSSALAKPTYKGGAVYDGTEKNIEDYLEGFDEEYMELIGDGVKATLAGKYFVNVRLKDTAGITWADGTTANIKIEWTVEKSTLIPNWDEWEFVGDGVSGFAPVISNIADGLASGDSIDYVNDFTYKIFDEDGNVLDASQVAEVGSYRIVATINGDLNKNYKLDEVSKEWYFVVVPKSGMTIFTVEWDETEFLYDGKVHYPKPTVKDRDGNILTDSEVDNLLKFSEGYKTHKDIGTYTVKAAVKDSDSYFIRSGSVCKFKIVDENGYAPDEDETNSPSGDIGSGNTPGGNGGALDELLEKLKGMPLWQLIASGISILLIIIFMSKGFGYASKAKQSKKMAESKFKTYYAGAFLGLAFSGWTAIACVLMGLAVLSLVFMILEKNRYNKALIAFEEAKDEFERNRENSRRNYDDNRREEEYRRRDEDMKAMFMRMMGGNFDGMNMGQGMPVYQQGIGAEDIRGIVSDTVTALLPGMQQMLPQQASFNDEIMQKLLEKEEKNDETINRLIVQNERLMQQLAEKPAEKVIEKEVVASNANDELIKVMIEEQRAMREVMQRLAEQPAQQAIVQPQVIEKIVEKPVEKIVEKEVRVEVPVETVVEKVVEKPIVISTEAVGEAEKSKQVKKTPAPKKAPAPRLTLEEAYAKLTKEQKKYFDGLREYAMSKDSKCKEKLSTYFTTIGPSTTNPFIKLTIKKGITVALFKMEDEYLKDIRRNASGDGTKVKVKETEVPIGDKQAYDTAKDMVDLRIDQIDRYNDFLKEQRALRKS